MKSVRTSIFWFFILSLLGAFLWGTTNYLQASSDIKVTTTTDELNNDGDCSLREAIIAANMDTAVDGCIAGSGSDIIQLPKGVYVLSLTGIDEDAGLTGDLDVTGDVTIHGVGANGVVVDGDRIDRVFHIAAGASVTIENITIRNGSADLGGGIDNRGYLTVRSVNITENVGGGLVNYGQVTILNTAVYSNAGRALQNHGSMSLSNVTVSGNTADFGHLYNQGELFVVHSTLAYNTGTDPRRPGGLYNLAGSTATFQNSILAQNLNGNCSNAGSFISNGSNLEDVNTCLFNQPNDLPNTDPDLLPLQDNGGQTLTHALPPHSPAVDNVFQSCLGDDQRGFLRPIDGDSDGSARCDIGAFELYPPRPNLVVETFAYDADVAQHDDTIGTAVQLQIANTSDWATTNAYEIGLYISPDPVITVGDQPLTDGLIAGPILNGGEAAWVTVPVLASIPDTFSPGKAYLGVIIDTGNEIIEQDESDNTAVDRAFVLPVGAYTWTVDSAVDDMDWSSLRFALTYARPEDAVRFDPGLFNPDTITLNTPLPALTAGKLTIDGRNAQVILDGVNLPAGSVGLHIASDENQVMGLEIHNMPQNGILVEGDHNLIGRRTGNLDCNQDKVGGPPDSPVNVIQNSRHGIFVSGDDNVIAGNRIAFHAVTGIVILSGRSNVIGGVMAEEGNVIIGNDIGLLIQGGYTAVHNNYIGTEDGLFEEGSNMTGIVIEAGAEANQIGGDGRCLGNVISGNQGWGLIIRQANDNKVYGNIIGLDRTGQTALPNRTGGVLIENAGQIQIGNSRVSNSCDQACNLISGNRGAGIHITGVEATEIFILENFIGVTQEGTQAVGNVTGIQLADGGQYTEIIANVIAGNDMHGVSLTGTETSENKLFDNWIGTNPALDPWLGNGDAGVYLANGAYDNVIGSGNIIGQNGADGIWMRDSHNNLINTNGIGTTLQDTTVQLGNFANGILIDENSTGNIVYNNQIAHNADNGIQVDGPGTIGNTFRHNIIGKHSGLRIENVNGGNLEIPPASITLTENKGGNRWDIQGEACDGCVVELFFHDSTTGEMRYADDMTVNPAGVFRFNNVYLSPGEYADFTVTGWNNNTSEYTAETEGTVDLQVTAVEVTQAIQTLSNEIPLIADKDTFVRVHAQSQYFPVYNQVTLRVVHNSQLMGTITPNVAATCPDTILVKTEPSREEIGEAFCFALDPAWTGEGSLSLEAHINPDQTVPELDNKNNERSASVNFEYAKPLSIKAYLVNYPETIMDRATIEDTYTIDNKLAVGDIDGDGLDDILIGDGVDNFVYVFSAESPGSKDIITKTIIANTYTIGDDLAAGDINNNGRGEMVRAEDETGILDILEYDPAADSWALLLSFEAGFSAHDSLAVGDVTGDGRAEIIIGNDATGEIIILELRAYNADPPFEITRIADVDHGNIGDLTVTDITMDGVAEILVGDYKTRLVHIYNLQGNELVPPSGLPTSFWAEFTEDDALAAGDVDNNRLANGNNYAEILVAGDICRCIDIFAWTGAAWELKARADGWNSKGRGLYSIGGSLAVGNVIDSSSQAEVITGNAHTGHAYIYEKNAPGEWRFIQAEPIFIDGMVSIIERMYPIPHVELRGVETITFDVLDGTPYNGKLYERLRDARTQDGDDYSPYVAILNGLGEKRGGQASGGKVTVFAMNLDSNGNPVITKTPAHEVGHTLGRSHINVPRCGPAGERYPNPNGDLNLGAAGGPTFLRILDVAQPGDPVPISSAWPFYGYFRDVAVQGNYAYVANYLADGNLGGGISIFDITNEGNPVLVSETHFEGGARRIDVAGNYAYVADAYGGLITYDISNPQNAVPVSQYTLYNEKHEVASYANDVQVAGGYLYLIDYPYYARWGKGRIGGNLHIFDLSDPANPKLLTKVKPDGWPNGVTVQGGLAYVADKSGLRIYDVSDPENVSEVGEFDPGIVIHDVSVAGDYAYVVGSGGFYVLDISDMSNIRPTAALWQVGASIKIQVVGQRAYLASQLNGLQIVNITNPAAPFVEGEYKSISRPFSVDGFHVIGDRVYLTSWENDVYGFDVGEAKFGKDPRVLNGYTNHDLMSYCRDQWMSPYTYAGIREAIELTHP